MFFINHFRKYHQPPLLHLDKKQKIIAGVIFVSLSLAMYFWLYAGRKVFIYLAFATARNNVEYKLDHWLYFDWFLAMISSILAFSFVLKYLFGSPRKVFETHYRKRVNIVVDQSFLIYNFFYIFIKGFLFYGFLMLIFTPNLLRFKQAYIFVFDLIVIVLFLQLWQSIFRYFRRKSYKYFSLSVTVILLYSLILSQLNLISPEHFDRMVRNSRLVYKNHLHVPAFPVSDNFYYSSPVFLKRLYVFRAKSKINGLDYQGVNVAMDRQEYLSDKELEQKFYDLKNDTLTSDFQFFGISSRPKAVVFKSYIDKQIKMPYVEKIFRLAGKYNFRDFAFVINNDNGVLKYRLPGAQDSLLMKHRIVVAKYGYYYLDGKEIKRDELKSALQEFYRDKSQDDLLIVNDPDAVFDDYIYLLSMRREALLSLNN